MITVAVVPKYRRTALVSAAVAAASLAGSLGARGMTAAGPAQPFPPHVLREYVFLADGERGAILGPKGISRGCVCPLGQ